MADAVAAAGYDRAVIDTFAYQYTRQAPTGIVPRNNVIVRLCTIECCFRHTLDDPACEQNVALMKDLRDWAAICDRLYIWDYTTNYSNTCLFFPDLNVIQRNIQVFYENHVKGVYEEGNYYIGYCDAEFGDLRAYMISKCLQDPYRDLGPEVEGFLEAFYGPGLSLPLSSANTGRHRSETLPFGARDLRGVDDRLRVVGISTNAVRVSYDNLRAWTITEKNLALPQIEGAPLQGIATVSVVPDQSFTISGSEKRAGEFIGKGIRLPLDAVSVEGKIDGFEAAVPIRIPAESGITSVAPSNALVRVTIEIAASTEAPAPVALPVDPGAKPLLPAPDEPGGEPVEIVDDPTPPPAEFPEDDEDGEETATEEED